MPDPVAPWRICIDTGGTFTDAVGVDPAGATHHAKVLSTSALRGVLERQVAPQEWTVTQRWGLSADVLHGYSFTILGRAAERALVKAFHPGTSTLSLDRALGVRSGETFELGTGEEAPVLAARLLTRTPLGSALPPLEMRLATTRGTNALLTRRGGRVVLFVTRGFRDLLEIGTQQRRDIFALSVTKPPMLYEHVVEVDERVSATGEVLGALEEGSLIARARAALAAGAQCAAIALLHSDRFPAHERRVGEILRGLGFAHVSCSHEAAPFIKVVPRAETAVIDAYLAPVIAEYLRRVRSAIAPAQDESHRLLVLTSAGGLVGAGQFRAKDSLLSGPAGGVVGARRAARRSGFARAISFDMGGTSTDVARLDDDVGLVFEHEVADAHLVAPAVGVESVAAGGGSICGFDGARLTVGPASAGAAPGPACYGAGGPLTLTDVNLLLGRLDPARLPIPISRPPAERALDQVRERMRAALGAAPPPEKLLEGFLQIAAERMGGAVRRVSARQGYDPRDYALVAFGGAGGQHACDVAGLLGIETIVVPAEAGVLSAAGLRAARIERLAERQVLRPYAQVRDGLELLVRSLRDEAAEEARRAAAVAGAATGGEVMEVRCLAALRLEGQESTLEIGFDDWSRLPRLFARRYREVYGHEPEQGAREIELVWVRAVASVGEGGTEGVHSESEGARGGNLPTMPGTWRACFQGTWREVTRLERLQLTRGLTVDGPAIVFEDHGAAVVCPGWSATVDQAGALVLRRAAREQPAEHAPGSAGATDEIALELFTSRCESIAREMGEALRRTAVSTNVKERLDFSCAVLDAEGDLIVNAPHLPVHLGSLGLCVRSVRAAIEMGPGDAVVTNHPALGGSHLPDVTIITPIHDDAGWLLGYAASRAHHAEIGGVRPGSMPPGATRLAEEGVIIAPLHLVRAGQGRYDEMARVLRGAPYPSRAVADNVADMRAAVAANQRGAQGVREMAREMGAERVGAFFELIKQRGAQAARTALRTLAPGVHEALEHMDDGAPLRVRITVREGDAEVDFTGSAPQHPGNLNATPAIVRSTVIYVLRLLVREPMPLNEGLMRAVSIVLPPGMLNPEFGASDGAAPAVAGGNVETSQRVVDTLLKALGVAACSQGTMNNTIFGAEGSAKNYYETVCGGSGATPEADGADAVHTHMTNTRITDPEILETRYPVRLELFEIRRGSGGAGRRRGGDGAVRALTFLSPSSLSLLTQHRCEGPYGVAGGAPGAPGRQRIIRASGAVEELASSVACEMNAGDTLILETPGGGGYGTTEL